MKAVLLVALLINVPLLVAAQKETTVWYFGRNIGLDFNDNQLTPLSGSGMDHLEGTASMADKLTGELLFYSDGIRVWNRNRTIMPSGNDLLGSTTSTQSALIVPYPQQPNWYYLFTVKAANDGSSPSFHYSVIDMNLEAGLGDIIKGKKNLPLLEDATEKLTAVPHANGRDYWVITHQWDSDAFYVYLLTSEGIAQPLIETIGSIHRAGPLGDSQAMGYLKASPNSKLLGCAVHSAKAETGPLELYDFDNQTGKISNYRSLGEFNGLYGLSFSPDNSKLYVTQWRDGLFQYDVSLSSRQQIIASRTKLVAQRQILNSADEVQVTNALQIGPDGKIYAANYYPNNMYPWSTRPSEIVVIHQPNKAGNDCQVGFQSVSFEDGRPGLGLPNFIQSYFNNLEAGKPLAPCMDTVVRIAPNPTKDFVKIIIEGDCQPLFSLRIINTLGQRVSQEYVDLSQQIEVDMTSMAAGLYFYIFTYSSHQTVKKVVKQ